ncbi:microviridin/marinostatin family tricyclic proteinase inhibitor [Chryseobacterium sp. MYb264]|uniref:microviridin/marinostatin family tricyclic proteinase inhibitor n=1 Tax=Chryseobacterium sp. MYb264 TaxID=2745153 RepID=UPI002E1496C7|nr:microviridin/marinostatin family tricyclic proteinase inhibitor [Chryseobacterium sp. MYb264]
MKKKNLKKPFFAFFLEKQIQEPQNVQGGSTAIITAPLIDASTAPVMDGISSPVQDHVTLKYPSDSDESGEISIIEL